MTGPESGMLNRDSFSDGIGFCLPDQTGSGSIQKRYLPEKKRQSSHSDSFAFRRSIACYFTYVQFIFIFRKNNSIRQPLEPGENGSSSGRPDALHLSPPDRSRFRRIPVAPMILMLPVKKHPLLRTGCLFPVKRDCSIMRKRSNLKGFVNLLTLAILL